MLDKNLLQVMYDESIKEECEAIKKNTKDIIEFIEDSILVSVQNLKKRVYFNFSDTKNTSLHYQLYPRKFNNVDMIEIVKHFESCKFKVCLRSKSGETYKTGLCENYVDNNKNKITVDELLKLYFDKPMNRNIDIEIYFLD
jgi:hypothetical protein